MKIQPVKQTNYAKRKEREKRFLSDIKRCRNITFAYIGMAVEIDGEHGTIAGMNSSGNLDVRFKPRGATSNCHPFWRAAYFDKNGEIVADYRESK